MRPTRSVGAAMDNELPQHLGAEVRRARVAMRLTQADAAERVGVSVEFYARMERGGTLPSVPTLQRLARVLAVSADVLLGLGGHNEKRPATAPTAAPVRDDEADAVRRRIIRKLQAADRETLRFVSRLVAGLEALRAHRARLSPAAAESP